MQAEGSEQSAELTESPPTLLSPSLAPPRSASLPALQIAARPSPLLVLPPAPPQNYAPSLGAGECRAGHAEFERLRGDVRSTLVGLRQGMLEAVYGQNTHHID